MQPSDPTQRLIKAAQGFIELGMLEDAAMELENIQPNHKTLPEVLAVRVSLYQAAEKWDLAAEVSRRMVQLEPHKPEWWISRADAVRRSESIEKAEAILLKAAELHPQDCMIRFNLACYASASGRVPEAKAHLREAIELNEGIRQFILDHRDLEPVWESICKDMPPEMDDLM